ncbi:protein kinase [Chloracidobacterium sp. D]|uniref:serine/threonine-protein kinase n=1 Tax=Chloracidobacterium sp. D TaxID=2821536 RepID=UPI001B8D985D|nr:serine/threonine-protein kinase [Chloracidobacterium sp. D]QUV81418.1 protein kinase [Chloracidobacterium sp. D]
MKRCPTCGTEYPDNAQFCPHDGATLVSVTAAPDDPFIGQVLAGRYEVLSKLGEGGMGSVYAARHRTLGRVDAVKVLRPEAADADAGRRFLREAKLAASINHPNAVVIHDFGQTESGVTFLAMEYIQGQSLTKLLQREGPLPLARVVNIIRQVASALDAAHHLGVIHRDLKPDNIMVMEGDRVKVVDFGIAKAVGGQESVVPMTQVGFVVGTPHYMSPEQVMGSPLDARSDVYSLALVAYEMLTGARAFAGDSMQAQMVARLSEPPRPMSVAAPHVAVPAAIEGVVRQALARLPADRPASAGAFAAQLEKALVVMESTQPVTSPPPGSVPTQYQGATVSTAGGSAPATAQPPQPAPHEGFRPPGMPGVSPVSSGTVVQPNPSPPPMAAIPLSPTLPTPAARPPLTTPSGAARTNFWLIGGLVAGVGIVLLALVVGVGLYVFYVRTDPGPVPVEKDVAAILQQSRSLREVSNYESALRLVDEALAANPTSPQLRIEKAEILFEQERFVESEDIVYAVLRSHPNYGPAYQNLGVLQYRQGKVAEAIANQKRCLELDPEPEYACYAHGNLAQIYAEQYFSNKRKFAARSNEAEMEARWALSTATRKSLEVSPRLVLAELFIDRQQYALAREQLEKLMQDNAIKTDRERGMVYAQLAVVAFFEKKYAEAAEAAERATQLDPQNKDYQKLARALRQYRR